MEGGRAKVTGIFLLDQSSLLRLIKIWFPGKNPGCYSYFIVGHFSIEHSFSGML